MNGAHNEPPRTERDLFLEALERSTPEERVAFLDQACANDPSLRAAAKALLRNHAEDGFLESPAVIVPAASRPTEVCAEAATQTAIGEKPGDQVGHYRLLQQIGEGGVGVVFMAEQEAPVRRRVALKVLKPGMDTKSVIARFESERQALALMDHPNIAKVLDAGSTATGRPFFVMELVRGIRITEYCDRNRLNTGQRLDLFVRVCQAVQHAHQKGIIHRDIKPSNILVTLHDGAPVPKVIDFGIAKATDQRLTDKTLFTEFQSFVGTPAYVSPEQAEMSGLDIDTRTDIYSLGVLLYELLTGRTPFDSQELWSSGLDGMRRMIREREPARPSTRLRSLSETDQTTTAQRQQIEPAKLTRLLKGDLDWIVLRALEKDRMRRYATANDLAQDIRRYLECEPILARPPSATYRFRKLVRRNKLVFAGAGAFTAALVIGLAVSTWQFIDKNAAYRRASEAEREQSRLRQEAETARESAINQALVARRQAYAADMNLAQQALAANNLGRAEGLLGRHRPEKGEQNRQTNNASPLSAQLASDLRGWEWRYLWERCQSDALFTLCELPNEISALSVSHDGKWVAIAESGDNGISIWDLRARQEIERFAGRRDRAPLAFSPTAPLLAFSTMSDSERGEPGTFRGQVRLWDAASHRYVGDLPVEGACRALAFSADGSRLLVAGSSTTFSIWDVARRDRLTHTKAPVSSQPGGRPMLGGSLVVTPDLSLAAEAIGGGRIRLVDLMSGEQLWTAEAAEENVTALAFSPDGKRLASGAGFVESAVRVWDVASGSEVARLEGHRTYVRSLVFWPDGDRLASASGDQTIHLWDVADLGPASTHPASRGLEKARLSKNLQPIPEPTQARVLSPQATLRGHRLEVWSLALGPDNTTLVSGCKDGSVFVWDTGNLRTAQAHVTLPIRVRAWRFAPNGEAILTLDAQGKVERWQGLDFQQSQLVIELEEVPRFACFSANGQFLATDSTGGATRVWDLRQGALLREFASSDGALAPVDFLGQSNHLVTTRGRDGYFQEWEVTTGHEIRSWRLPTPSFRGKIAFAPDESRFFALGGENTGEIHELHRSQPVQLDTRLEQISDVAFSPQGHWFAAVNILGIGKLWDTATGRLKATLRGFLQGAHSIAFSPDGQRLAIGSNGNEAIKVWDVESLQELITLKGQGSMFSTVSFSPDGDTLASSNSKGILHIWRAPSFADIERIEARSR